MSFRVNYSIHSGVALSSLFGSKPVATSVRLRLLIVHGEAKAYTLMGVESRGRQRFWVLESKKLGVSPEDLFAQVCNSFNRILGPEARWRTGADVDDFVASE